MAITKNILASGPANYRVHLYFEQDGTLGGELSNYAIVDPAADFPKSLPKGPSLRIMSIWWGFAWFDGTLSWGGLNPRPVWTLPRDTGNCVDFSVFGGLSDLGQPPPSDDNGKLLISTSGFATLGSQGTLVIAFRQ